MMPLLRAASLILTLTAVLLAATGCKPAESDAQAPGPADAAVAATNETSDAATGDPADAEPEPQAETEGAATDAAAELDTPIEGNVITRSLPRFHDAFASDDEFRQWMESFYIHQEFERTPEAIGYYCSSQLFESYESRVPMSAFFGGILAQSDETVDLCYDELSLEGRVAELIMLGYAAWFANTEHSRDMIFQARQVWDHESIKRMFNAIHISKIVDTLERDPREDPRIALMLWFEFFATGDEERLRKVVGYAYMHTAPEGTWQRAAGQYSNAILTQVLPYDSLVRGVVEEQAVTSTSVANANYLTRKLEEVGPLRPRPEITPES